MPIQVSLAQVWSYLSAGQPGHTDAGLALQQKLEPLNCHVERISLFRSSALELRLYSEQPLDGHILSEIQNALRILLGIREVRLFVRFSAETLEAGDAACRLLPWLLRTAPSCARTCSAGCRVPLSGLTPVTTSPGWTR